MVLSRQATARLLLLTGIAVAFGWAWQQFNTIPLLVMGQPTSVGLLQREQEAPFFEGLAGRTGLPLKITYRPLESLSIKETHQLETLLEGSVDIVSLRIRQNSPKEPTLEGLDLPGTITDFATASRVAMAYGPTVDRHLQRSFRAKLLGTWSLGPPDPALPIADPAPQRPQRTQGAGGEHGNGPADQWPRGNPRHPPL